MKFKQICSQSSWLLLCLINSIINSLLLKAIIVNLWEFSKQTINFLFTNFPLQWKVKWKTLGKNFIKPNNFDYHQKVYKSQFLLIALFLCIDILVPRGEENLSQMLQLTLMFVVFCACNFWCTIHIKYHLLTCTFCWQMGKFCNLAMDITCYIVLSWRSAASKYSLQIYILIYTASEKWAPNTVCYCFPSSRCSFPIGNWEALFSGRRCPSFFFFSKMIR